MAIALALCFVGCATPTSHSYARSSAPLPPEPAGEKYLDRPDVQRALEPPFHPEPEPAPRP